MSLVIGAIVLITLIFLLLTPGEKPKKKQTVGERLDEILGEKRQK